MKEEKDKKKETPIYMEKSFEVKNPTLQSIKPIY